MLQVTFLEAFLRIGSLTQRTPDGFFRWLRRIAENNLRDAVRALEREKRPDAQHRVTRGADGESSRTLLQAIRGNDSTVGGRAVVEEQVKKMNDAIEKLPASYRVVIREVDLNERPVSEVSEELGKSAGAVHMLRSRAVDRLRELLRSEPF